MKAYIDANIFIRHLTQDHPVHSAKSRALFAQLETGQIEAYLCEAVITDICFVLSSKALYGLSHQQIRDMVGTLLQFKGIRTLEEKNLYLHALDIFAQYPHLDITDALIVARMQHDHISYLLSFDTGFDHIAGIQRLEAIPTF